MGLKWKQNDILLLWQSRRYTSLLNKKSTFVLFSNIFTVFICVFRTSRDVLRDETTVAPGSSFKQSGIYTRSDGDWSPIQRCFTHSWWHLHVIIQKKQLCNSLCILFSSHSPGNSRPTSPKSDSELLTKPSDAAKRDPAMHWAWGELPQAAKVTENVNCSCTERTTLFIFVVI